RLRALRLVFPTTRRRPHRARQRLSTSARPRTNRHTQPPDLGHHPHHHRRLRKSSPRRHLLSNRRRSRLHGPDSPLHPRRLDRNTRFRRPDFLRFRRLFTLRHRHRPLPRLRTPRQLPLPLRSTWLQRLLAPLAHFTIHLAPRLSLYFPRRKPP